MAQFSQMTSEELGQSLYEERGLLAEIEENSGRYEIGKFEIYSRIQILPPPFISRG